VKEGFPHICVEDVWKNSSIVTLADKYR